MSCGNPATDPDALMPRRRKFDNSNTCIRCKQSAGNIVVRHAVYCKACFIPLVTHRFRRSLEPSINPTGQRRTVLQPSGNLLIGVSGGLGSTVLLDLIDRCYYSEEARLSNQQKGGKEYPRNDVWKKVSVCYVDICEAFPDMRDRTDEIRRVVLAVNPDFDFIPLRLSHAFDQDWWHSTGTNPNRAIEFATNLLNEDLAVSSISGGTRSATQGLKSYLTSLPTQTSLHTTIKTLIRVLLLNTARHTDSSHVLFGTSLTSLAISLISSISQGGGFNVREEMREDWMPTSLPGAGVRVVRPLQDIGLKECAAYAWWNKLTVVGKDRWPGSSRQDIGGLTKEFIVGLEKNYPSTVSTITRTCAKLASKDDAKSTCVLCERPLQEGSEHWKSRISIKSLDTKGEDTRTSSSPSLSPYLCYACHTTLTSKSARAANVGTSPTPVVLPVWAQARLSSICDIAGGEEGEIWSGKAMSEQRMKSVVGDFLLEDLR